MEIVLRDYCPMLLYYLAIGGFSPFSLASQNSGWAESRGAFSLGAQTTVTGWGSGGGCRCCVEPGEARKPGDDSPHQPPAVPPG